MTDGTDVRSRAGGMPFPVPSPLSPHCPRGRHRMLAIALLAALSGCATLPPPAAESTPAPLPAHWPDASPAQQSAAASLDWQHYFTDPQLQALIHTALEHNSDLRLALTRMQQAQAAFRIQRADQLPAIGATVGQVRAGVPDNLQPLLRESVLEGNIGLVGFSSWELDLWGRVRKLKRAALENWLASAEAQRAVRVSLIAQVANAWLALAETDERLALTERTIASRQQSWELFRKREQVGAISRLQLTQVETLLLQARALGAQLHQTRETQAHALQQLVGAPVGLPVPLPAGALDHAFAPLQPGLPSDLLARRPDLRAAEHQLAAARANVGAARDLYFPQIALTGALGSTSTALSGLFDAGTGTWLFHPSISLPILDGGKRNANLRLNQAREQAALADYDKAVQAAFREVSDALSARTWLGEQVDIATRSVEVLGERARLATLRYDAGSSSYLEVLDAERDLLGARQQQVTARRALAASQVSLYAALGGDETAALAFPSSPDSSAR